MPTVLNTKKTIIYYKTVRKKKLLEKYFTCFHGVELFVEFFPVVLNLNNENVLLIRNQVLEHVLNDVIVASELLLTHSGDDVSDDVSGDKFYIDFVASRLQGVFDAN